MLQKLVEDRNPPKKEVSYAANIKIVAINLVFRKVLKAQHTHAPRVITVAKNAAYPVAIKTLKADETIAAETELRQSKYLNNVIE